MDNMTTAQLEHNLKVMIEYHCPLVTDGWMYSIDDVRRELAKRRGRDNRLACGPDCPICTWMRHEPRGIKC